MWIFHCKFTMKCIKRKSEASERGDSKAVHWIEIPSILSIMMLTHNTTHRRNLFCNMTYYYLFHSHITFSDYASFAVFNTLFPSRSVCAEPKSALNCVRLYSVFKPQLGPTRRFTVCFAVTYSQTPAKNSSLHNWAPHKRWLGASGVQTSCAAERTASFISCHTLSSGSCATQSATGSNLEATWGCVYPREFWHKPA